MKELSIQERAEAYDKVREKIALRFGSNVAEEIFSQFEMSEDERIRKELLDFCKTASTGQTSMLVKDKNQWFDWIAWLEKQGKNNMGISETTKQKLEDNLNKALEKETPESLNKFLDEQGSQILANSAKTCKDEQKPADTEKGAKGNEADLDEEADNYWGTLTSDVRNSIYLNDFYKIAKHFFELGINASNKAQKGE